MAAHWWSGSLGVRLVEWNGATSPPLPFGWVNPGGMPKPAGRPGEEPKYWSNEWFSWVRTMTWLMGIDCPGALTVSVADGSTTLVPPWPSLDVTNVDAV